MFLPGDHQYVCPHAGKCPTLPCPFIELHTEHAAAALGGWRPTTGYERFMQQAEGAMGDKEFDYWRKRGVLERILRMLHVGRATVRGGDWWVFPILNGDDFACFFKLKKTPWSQNAKQAKAMTYPSGNTATLYLPTFITDQGTIIICEGESDVMTVLSHGQAAVSSTHGAGVWRKQWCREFPMGCTVILAFDRDEAGQKGRAKVREAFRSTRTDVLVSDFFIPDDCPGNDVNGYFLWNNEPFW